MANSIEYFFTIAAAVTTEEKIKGSRFIAYLEPAPTKDQAETFIQQISKKHYDATHNCFAYRIGQNEHEITRFSDDGEPSGTAGKPILQAIYGADLTDVALVVTRYFGGTKLGTGGLIRAYGGAAAQALAAAKRVQIYHTQFVELECNYSFLNTVLKEVEQIHGRIAESRYTDTVWLKLELRAHTVAPFTDFIINQSAGTVIPKL